MVLLTEQEHPAPYNTLLTVRFRQYASDNTLLTVRFRQYASDNVLLTIRLLQYASDKTAFPEQLLQNGGLGAEGEEVPTLKGVDGFTRHHSNVRCLEIKRFG